MLKTYMIFEIIESCSYFYMVSSSFCIDFVMAVTLGMVFRLISPKQTV